MPETFADLLRGQSQAKIARAIGESRALVNTWARGKSVPQVRHLPKLSKILRVDIGKLANVIAHDAQTESRVDAIDRFIAAGLVTPTKQKPRAL